jgi:hypothetical protein
MARRESEVWKRHRDGRINQAHQLLDRRKPPAHTIPHNLIDADAKSHRPIRSTAWRPLPHDPRLIVKDSFVIEIAQNVPEAESLVQGRPMCGTRWLIDSPSRSLSHVRQGGDTRYGKGGEDGFGSGIPPAPWGTGSKRVVVQLQPDKAAFLPLKPGRPRQRPG